jgi:single-stranded-DNA-specific exonuclease
MAIFHAEPGSLPAQRRSLIGARWSLTAPDVLPPAGVHPILGQILAARGVSTPDELTAFLSADLSSLADPFLLPDMDAAVAAVLETLAQGGRIRIFGDYDADGLTSTALLVRALSALGGTVDWFVPHRIDEGYGLNQAALAEAKREGIALGITVDNGITAHAQLAHARDIGLAMIVTDHHEPDGVLPPAIAVLNPKRPDSPYPYRELAGVGVAYTLLRALCQRRGLPESAAAKFLDLVTIGTIADVAPLTGENRVLVRQGLPALTLGNKKLGLGALLRAAGVKETATCTDVAFLLGPRLNAAGRIAHGGRSLELLLTGDRTEAETLAAELCTHNTHRQEEEARTLESALAMVDDELLRAHKVLVLASAEWHPGIIGIVASRLVERYNRPCALIAVQNGVGKGSARARAPFHLWEALNQCTHLLHRFGGHRVAAGFELEAAQIPALRAALNVIGERTMSDEDLAPLVEIDSWLELKEVTTNFAREIDALAPFGMGNPTPVFAATEILVQKCFRCGPDGAHASLRVQDGPGGRLLPAIWFRRGELIDGLRPGAHVDLAFTVGLNTYQGVTTAQLVLKDIRC